MKSSRNSIAVLVLSALALVAGVCPSRLAADPTRGHNLQNATYTHLVKVDSSGHQGDYKDLSEALAWVTGKTPACTAPWTVQIYGGVGYTEATLTLPPCTTLQGVPGRRPTIGLTGMPVITLTGTTGALITPGASSALSDLEITYTATPTGATQIFNAASVSAVLSNVLFTATPGSDAQNLDVIATSGTGSLTAYGVSVNRGAGTATKTRDLVAGGSGVTNVYGGVFATAGTSQAKLLEVTAGALNLYGVQLGTAATTQLTQTAGTLLAAGTPFTTTAGTITGAPVFGSTVTGGTVSATTILTVATHTPASAAEACTAGTLTSDSAHIYYCVSSGVWVRGTMATW